MINATLALSLSPRDQPWSRNSWSGGRPEASVRYLGQYRQCCQQNGQLRRHWKDTGEALSTPKTRNRHEQKTTRSF